MENIRNVEETVEQQLEEKYNIDKNQDECEQQIDSVHKFEDADEHRISSAEEDLAQDIIEGAKFTWVNHHRRAESFYRLSDGNTTEFVNIALEYFGNRCALSGERCVMFDEPIVRGENNKISSNLSAEHVIALAIGGDDIAPNIVPAIYQYNLKKNGYYILDWWTKQNDANGKSLYTPERLLKLTNFMLKSLQARKSGKQSDIEEYRKAILIPNVIDEYLSKIEKEDELLDNSERKILSDTITATTIVDNEKLLTKIPEIEDSIPSCRIQLEEKGKAYQDTHMIEYFLYDAIKLINEDRELGNREEIISTLDNMYENIAGTLDHEVTVRNYILELLNELGIKNNQYTIANDWLTNTNILQTSEGKGKEEIQKEVRNLISNFQNKYDISEEKISRILSANPSIIYDKGFERKIELWKRNGITEIEELLVNEYNVTGMFIDVLLILQEQGIDLMYLNQTTESIKELIEKTNEGLIEDERINFEEVEKSLENQLGIKGSKIDLTWKIGSQLHNVKAKKEKLIKELEYRKVNGENIFGYGVMNKLIGVEKDKIVVLVDILEKLQDNGVDLSYLTTTIVTVEELIEKCNESGMKIDKMVIAEVLNGELASRGGEIDLTWKIGGQLHNAKLKKEELKKELESRKKDGKNTFSEEIVKKIVGVEKSSMSILVDVLKLLQDNGIDLMNLKEAVRDIEELRERCNQNGAQIDKKVIEEAFKGVVAANGTTIDLKWPIGSKLNRERKWKKELRKELESRKENGENIFNEEIIKSIVGNEIKAEKNRIQIFVDVLEKLQARGVDLRWLNTKIVSIESLIEKCNGNEIIDKNGIEEDLVELVDTKGKQIDLKWNIGSRLEGVKKQKKELRKELESRKENGENIFNEEIIKSIVGNEIKVEKTKIQIFVDVLEKLQAKGIDLNCLSTANQSISKLIKKCNAKLSCEEILIDEESVENALKGEYSVSGDAIDLTWDIGIQWKNIRIQKEELRKELESRKNGEGNVFSEDVIQRIAGIEKNQPAKPNSKIFDEQDCGKAGFGKAYELYSETDRDMKVMQQQTKEVTH